MSQNTYHYVKHSHSRKPYNIKYDKCFVQLLGTLVDKRHQQARISFLKFLLENTVPPRLSAVGVQHNVSRVPFSVPEPTANYAQNELIVQCSLLGVFSLKITTIQLIELCK